MSANIAKLRKISMAGETGMKFVYLAAGGAAIYLLYTIYKAGKGLGQIAGKAVDAAKDATGTSKTPEETKQEFPLFKSGVNNPWSSMFHKDFEKKGIPVHILTVADRKRISSDLYDLLGNPLTIVMHPMRSKSELGQQVLDYLKAAIKYKTQLSNLNDEYSANHPDLYTDIRDNLYSVGGIGSGASLDALRAILSWANNLPTGN